MTEIWTLPNGLRIVGDPLDGLRTVSVGVWLHVGSMMEKPEENGELPEMPGLNVKNNNDNLMYGLEDAVNDPIFNPDENE